LARKKQSQFKANRRVLAGNPKHEALNPKQLHFSEYDLKKQSQFVKGKNGCKCIYQKYLWRFFRIYAAKKQSQSKPISKFRNPIREGFSDFYH